MSGESGNPYDLSPEPVAPELPGETIIRPAVEDVFDAMCADIYIHSLNCTRSFGDFHLALSGDPSLTPLYMQLMVDPKFRDLPWKRTHVWMVEDAHGDDASERRRFHEIEEILGEHSGIPKSNLHPTPIDDRDAHLAYERELREALSWREKGHDRLDCVVLSVTDEGAVGANGDARQESQLTQLIVHEAGSAVRMTESFVNASRMIAVLASGETARLRLTSGGGATHPAQSLAPLAGALRWYLDHSVCRTP